MLPDKLQLDGSSTLSSAQLSSAQLRSAQLSVIPSRRQQVMIRAPLPPTADLPAVTGHRVTGGENGSSAAQAQTDV